MSRKLRVYELAKHYGVESPAILKMMRDMHAEVKSHMSVVEDDVIEKIHASYQRKREVMRLDYAKMHKMDPEKLKHVASFRPLDMPESPDEPEETKPAKKKAAKKKVAKKKVAKKKVAKKDTAEKTIPEPDVPVIEDAPVIETPKSVLETVEAPTDPREKRPIRRARIVRRGPAPEPEQVPTPDSDEANPMDAAVDATGAPAAAVKDPADVSKKTEKGPGRDVVPAVDGDEAAAMAEASDETSEADVQGSGSTPAVTKSAKPTKDQKQDQAKPVRRQARIIRMGEGYIATTAGKAQPKAAPKARQPQRPSPQQQQQPNQDTWNWDQVSRDLTGRRRQRPATDQDSVRDSVQAAIQRRQEARDQTVETGRRTRRKQKVDDATVTANVKQTIAQMDHGTAGKRRRRKGGSGVDHELGDHVLRVTEFITVQELAEKFEITARDVIGKLFALGVMVTINQRLKKDQIEMLAEDFEKEIEFLSEFGEDELEEVAGKINEEDLVYRAPVVTVMGHVDHGKTSLLDYIRSTNVIAGEAGGITQHMAAYRVQTPNGPITFLDTPGHEAFSAMRARGAKGADIVILVVAADDRIMPQTIEAINHAKSAGVPMIIAINKCDLPAARPDLVRQDLLQHDILIEEFGGDVLCVEISAKRGDNIDKLLEQVHLQAEVLELRSSAAGPAIGTVVEATKEQGRGVVITILVDRGTLRTGDTFLVGMQDGRVRALLNERGELLEEATPGMPAVVLGANDVPVAGDRFHVLDSEREARDIAARRRHLQRVQQFSAPKKTITLDNLASMVASSDQKELPLIVKADVSGSVEAVCDAMMQLNTDEVQVLIVHKGVGAINESDVLLASNTGAMIVGFHMRPGSGILEKAKNANVTIETFDIIYEVVDTMRKSMAGLLDSVRREVSTGSAQIREVFRIPKVGTIAGAYVKNGTLIRNSLVRLVRDEMMIFEGKISSLKRFKDDVREVQQGFECGIGLENFHDLQEGDIVETYRIEEEERTDF